MQTRPQRLRWGGLRGKFMLFIGVVLFVLTASLTLINFRNQQKSITEREVEKARSIAIVLRDAVSDDLRNGADHFREHLETALHLEHIEYVYVFDAEGRVVSDGTLENKYHGMMLSDAVSLRAVTSHEEKLQFENGLLDVSEPLLDSQREIIGGVRVGYSMAGVESEVAFARNVSFGMGLILSVLAVLLSYIVVSRFTRPIDELKQATEQISEDRFQTPLKIESGDELEILGGAINRMARSLKASRGELIRAKDYTDNIITSMLDMLIVTDPSGVIRTVNRATCDALGYARKEIEGQHVQRFVPAFPMAMVDPEAQPSEDVIIDPQCLVRLKDGTTITASISGSIMYDHNGDIEGFVALAQDVSDRLRTERQLQMRAMQQGAIARLGQLALSSPSLQQVLDEAIRQVASTLDVSHNSVCELLPEKNALLLRAGVGWPEGIIGKAWVSADLDTQVGYTLSVNLPVVLEDLNIERRFRGTNLLRDHSLISGASVVIQTNAGPWGVLSAHTQEKRLFTEDDVNFLTAVANVISMSIEQHRQADALIAAKHEAEEMSRLKSSFLANMSHEIRTPLTIMIGYAEALTEMVPEETRAFAERIEQGGHRLLATLNSVLELSRLQAKEMKLNLEDIDLAAEVTASVSLYGEMAAAKGLELRISTPKETSMARIDRGSLHRILDNLVGNAIKFTRTGHVEVEVVEDTTRIYMNVRDTGIGIGQDFLPYLFDEFKQESTGEARSHEGSGLGLTITRQMVEMHGGRISVESEKGAGTTFKVWFPKIASRQNGSNSRTRADDRTPVIKSRVIRTGPRRRAMVLDDSLETRELLRFFLEPYFEMTIVDSADAVFASTWEGRFDLVLLDINIGDEQWSGLDVMAVLRKLPEYEKTPIIAVTAYALPGDEERFLEAGFDGYLSKPFVKAKLFEEIERLIGPVRDGRQEQISARDRRASSGETPGST